MSELHGKFIWYILAFLLCRHLLVLFFIFNQTLVYIFTIQIPLSSLKLGMEPNLFNRQVHTDTTDLRI